MRRKQTSLSEAIGTDAFLDIVANLVGILLIFLMVIGVRMEDASHSAKPDASAEVAVAPTRLAPLPKLAAIPDPLVFAEIQIPDASAAQLELSRVKSGIRETHEEAKELARLMQFKKLDRDNLMLAITKAEIELERRRAALDSSQQDKVALDLEIQQAKDAYEDILLQLEVAKSANAKPKSKVLQHIATPLAKTVFVREEHFRLKDGRLLFVPLNDMTNQLRNDAPKKMWKLKSARQTSESIGPQEGFEMRYTLSRNRVPFQTESGLPAVREVAELERFVMVPVGTAQGETIEAAMRPTSAFQSRISAWSPRDTIITVWTYPNSFGEFRQLKSELYKQGFLTAARPLPADQLISGSPQGTRSAAQ